MMTSTLVQPSAVLAPVCAENPPLEWEHIACNLCGSDDAAVYHRERLPYFKLQVDFTIVRCRCCGLVYTNPRLRDYNAVYLEGFTETPAQIEAHARAKKPVFDQALRQILERQRTSGQPAEGRLLDLGCGTGHFLRAAQEFGFTGTGVEPAAEPAHYAMDCVGVKVRQADIYNVALPQDHFDVITAWDVIEHVADPAGMLQRCAAWLKPGGILALRFPSAPWQKIKGVILHQWLRSSRPSFSPTMHLTFFDAATLTHMCRRTGLSVLDIHSTPLEINPGAPRLQNMAKRLIDVGLRGLETVRSKPIGNLEAYVQKPLEFTL